MTNIPFPNPNDADALNDYLDDLAAGKQVNPESDVERAAQEFHQLASRAEVDIPTQPIEANRGETTMQSTTLAAPISNRTRRQKAEPKKNPSRSYGWLIAAIVAALMISMIGSAWLNREPGNPHDQLAFAPGTVEPHQANWTQPVSLTECPEEEVRQSELHNNPSGLLYTDNGYDQVSPERDYDVVGPAEPEDARAVVARVRQTYACGMEGQTLPSWTPRFEYENRTREGQRTMDAISTQRDEGAEAIAQWYLAELSLTESDLVNYQDNDQFDLDGTEQPINRGPFNPGYAIELADGRIAIINTVVIDEGADYQPSVHEGLNVSIFAFQDGEWMLDENLPIRLDDARQFVWTQPISFQECPEDAARNAYDPDNPGGTQYSMEEYDEVSPERSYEIVGSPKPEDAEAVVVRLRETYGCIAGGKTTLKVTARFEYENRTTAGRESVEERRDERTAASESVSSWLESELGLTPTGMYIQQNPDDLNLDGTEALINQALYNPGHAVLFADGRIGVIPSVVGYSDFPMEVSDETIPGFSTKMSIFVFQDGEWMLDELLPICIGDCSALPLASPVGTPGDLSGEYWAETITGTPEVGVPTATPES